MREQSIIPSIGYESEFPIALDLLARQKIKVEPLVTAQISLDEIINKGFKALTGAQKAEHIKILVSPET